MPGRTTLYIDIDDTIIAKILPGSGRDLRPCVMSQLAVLGRMYDCCWLTVWPYAEPKRSSLFEDRTSIVTLMSCLYGSQINETFRYADWDQDHPQGKAELCSGRTRRKTGTGSKIRFSNLNMRPSPLRESWIVTSA